MRQVLQQHAQPLPQCRCVQTAGARVSRLAAGAAPQRDWRRQEVQQQQRGDSVVVASQPKSKTEAEATTEKYGLEAGLWKVWTAKGADGKSKGQQAKELLARYGSAYLITSISFAIVSMAACYAAVDAGVDVAALLSRIGLQVTDTSETVGTFTIAYAAHKALSPVRFPPTVALTPTVAKWLGKEPAPAAAGSEPGSSE